MPATIRDVAKLAGTSVGAVSAVLSSKPRHNIRVGEETRARIQSAAVQLSYTPNRIAQTLVTRKTGVIGLVFPVTDIFIDRSPFSTQIMAGLLEEVVRERYNLMLYTATGGSADEDFDAVLNDRRVDGLILVIPTVSGAMLSRCMKHHLPCVAVVADCDSEQVCTVNSDDFTGGRLATEHLIALGHRRIAHLEGNPDLATTGPRREGYFAALTAAGIDVDPGLVAGHGFGSMDGYDGMAALLALPPEQRPTAVFACNDVAANGAIQCLHAAGLIVPGDVSVVGFDDTWFAEIAKPHLTSVHMPIYEMGLLAAQTLIALVEGREVAQRHMRMDVSLTVRDSTAPPPPSSIYSSSNEIKETFLCPA